MKGRNPTFYTLVGSALLAISGAYISGYDMAADWGKVDSAAKLIAFLLTNPKLGLVVGVVLFVIGGIAAHYREKDTSAENDNLKSKVFTLENTLASSNRDLESANKKIQNLLSDGRELKEENFRLHEKKVETWLKGLCKYIDLDNTSRVSIYYVDNEHFKLLSRKSPNPLLSKFNPKLYKLEKGVLSLAWQLGKHVDDDVPEEDGKYSDHMKSKYGYTDDELAEIRMRSLFIMGLAIIDADDNIGVIVFESEKKNAFSKEKIENVEKYCNDFQSYLCGFIRDSRRYEVLALQDSASRNKVIHEKKINADKVILEQFEVKL
ncbi:TPA: GAF domain-containing protein [Vibrio cholerae]|uniref:GAF domain-containing protein n=1 Tax=Vibrio metoecus TaxID=1481663 RepID=UPI000510A55D|nr:GAF domain-containing protein [Vibrio metoecus]EJL8259206.1 GAF domain-containing protein [Vibrio cholerae]